MVVFAEAHEMVFAEDVRKHGCAKEKSTKVTSVPMNSVRMRRGVDMHNIQTQLHNEAPGSPQQSATSAGYRFCQDLTPKV
jgi:hypothetical protein